MSPAASIVAFSDALRAEGKSLFIGRDSEGPIFASNEDHLMVIGPPRSGKISGLLAPTIAIHPGPVLSVSIRHDVLQDTQLARDAIAESEGGQVVELELPGSSIRGQDALTWSLTDGCESWAIARDRAVSMVYAAVSPANGDTVWRDSAATALAGFLHGAALLGHSDADMVARIRLTEVAVYRDAVASLDPDGTHPSTLAFSWLSDDRVIAENTRRSVFFVLTNQVLGAFDYDLPSRSKLNLDSFLRSGASTVYLTIPFERRLQLAPLVAAFTDALVATWRRHHSAGVRNDSDTLLLVLDEAANISPISSLSGLLTTGAGDGIQVVFALQTPGQATAWNEQAEAVLTGTKLVALFPGIRDHVYLDSLAQLAVREMAYDPQVTVSPTWSAGEHNPSAERLSDERRYLERATLDVPARSLRRARLRAARRLATRRREERIRTVSDDSTLAESVLNEIIFNTEVRLDVSRRSVLEVSDLAKLERGRIALFVGAEFFQLQVQHWRDDILWSNLLLP